MSLTKSALKGGSNPPRDTSHGPAYDPYYGDMLDAIQYGTVEEAIQLFSRRGYDVNVEVEYVFDDGKKYNVTPLYWAVRYRKPKLCKYLLDHGARPFNNLVFEYYPLHEACSRGFSDVLRVFIDSKIDLNKPTPDGDTPLHIASMRGYVECVHLLLDGGANTGISNKAGRTPIQEALYQHQDDLVQLFQVYPDTTRDSSSSGVRLKRRLSLGSTRPPLRQQESSPAAVPCRRPKSFYGEPVGSYYEPGSRSSSQLLLSAATAGTFLPATTRSHSHQDLALSPAMPPKSTAPCHCTGSLTAAPSDHLYTPAKTVPSSSHSCYTGGSGGLSQPTLVSQLSIASSCAAESPSPVERDGVGRTLLDGKAHSKPSVSGNIESSANTSSVSTNASPTKQHTTKTDAAYHNTSSSLYSTSFAATSGTKKDTTPTVYVNSGRPHPTLQQPLWQQPSTHLPVTCSGGSLSVLRHHHPSKLQYRLLGSISNPEFSVLPEVMVSQEKRTQSSSNLYDRPAKGTVAPIEAQTISPCREKLNSLSYHVYSSYDEKTVNHPATSMGYLSLYTGPKVFSDSGGGTSSTSHPMFNIVQKIIDEMAPKLKLTPANIQSIIDSVYSSDLTSSLEHTGTRSKSSSSSCSFVDVPTSIAIQPCAESFLKELDVEVDSQPFDTKFGVPSSGFMVLKYHARKKKLSSVYTTRGKPTKDSHILKVILRVFNLKNWAESSQYHSQNPATLVAATSTTSLPSSVSSSFEHLSLSRPLQEVACLQKLSSVPHPNIAEMVCHFRATTSDQHHRFARNLDADNPQAVYTAGHTTDFVLMKCPTITLSKHFENLRKKHCGIIPETEVLVILAQLNLGIAHLVKNWIAHCSINPENICIEEEDSNRLLLANFAQSIEFSQDLSAMKDVRATLRLQLQSKSSRVTSLCPEVVQWLQQQQETETDYCYVQHNARTLFATSDSYAAARMLYLLLLGDSHETVPQLDAVMQWDQSSYHSSPLPHINSLSTQCNHLLQKLLSPNLSERMRPIEGAVASLVLLFGPHPLQVHSIEDCHQWLLAEAMQFYMRPVLTGSNDSDTSEVYKRLLCMYLTVADKAPCLVWKCCSSFKHLSA